MLKPPQDSYTSNYLHEFFSQSQGFRYDSSRPVWSEFDRMCRQSGLNGKEFKEEKHEVRKQLKDAITKQFNAIYGEDEHSIYPWQMLCQVLGVSPIPESIEECKAVRTSST